MSRIVPTLLVSLALSFVGCDTEDPEPRDPGASPDAATPPPAPAPAPAPPTTPPTTPPASPPPAPPPPPPATPPPPPPPMTPPPPPPFPPEMARDVTCADAPPEGAIMPPPLPPYTGGACPSIVVGPNTIQSSGAARAFLLVLPEGFDPATERAPVIVMWHWLGADADSFLSHGVQEAANRLRFIAIIPESKGDLELDFGFANFDPRWPYLNTSSDSRMEEEGRFFDDMVTCVAEQYPIHETCISTAGVSAGALWSSQLAQIRSERLASAIILSGGTGPATGFDFFDVTPWRSAARAVPMLVAWGGPTDQCGLNFNTASHNLESNLVANGSFVLECVHNCGHVEPPVNLDVIWSFAGDHPYWLHAGESPYLVRGLPEGAPTWCAMGVGNAIPRSEECPPAEGCPVPALPGL